MPTNFPASLDTLTTPSGASTLGGSTPSHTSLHTNEGDAIEALEAKVGVDGSAVTTSLDYKMAQRSLRLVVNIMDPPYNAVASGSTDNAAAIQAAIDAAFTAGGGQVYVPAGTYGFNGVITVKDRVALRGAGKLATTFKALNAAASIQFGTAGGGERRGLSGMFEIDGNNVATNPLAILAGANSDYIDIKVGTAAAGGTGVLVSGVQNNGIYSLEIQNCTKGLVFDRGCKNITITRGTINDCTNNVIVQMTAAHPTNANIKEPQRIVINDVLCETVTAGGIALQVNAGSEIFWMRGALIAPSVVLKTELLDPAALGSSISKIGLGGVQLSGSSTATIFQLLAGHDVFMFGAGHAQGMTTLFDIRHNNARIYLDHTVTFTAATTARYSTTVARTEAQIVSMNGTHDMDTTANYSAPDATTYVQATDLTIFSLPTNSVWNVEADLHFDGSTTGNGQMQWQIPAGGATFTWSALGISSTGVFACTGAGNTQVIRVRGLLKMGTTAGSVYPEFKQATLDAVVPTRLLTGSRVQYIRVRNNLL